MGYPWWYGWLFTCFIMLMLGYLDNKIPQRLSDLRVFGFLFRAGPNAVLLNSLMCAFIWPLMLTCIILIMIKSSNDGDNDFHGSV